VTELSDTQRDLIASLSRRLAQIPGMAAVVLGGSFARGRAEADSDIDLGLFYSEGAPFEIDAVRALAAEVSDSPAPPVTNFLEWGPWVNGGAWLTVGGQRVDFLYRSVEHMRRVIGDAYAGRFELHYGQQPPFGFFSGTYLGELAICVPLFDPQGVVRDLKREVSVYPEPLKRAVVQRYTWASEFALESFAPKFAARGDVLGTVGCLARVAHQLALVLFALNERYWLSDKTALREIAEFAIAPRAFAARVTSALANVGSETSDMLRQVAAFASLVSETVALCGALYRRPYPK
jgi:predicted nucleotidyltransferase